MRKPPSAELVWVRMCAEEYRFQLLRYQSLEISQRDNELGAARRRLRWACLQFRIANNTQPNQSNMDELKRHIQYYKSWYTWPGPENIRKWNLRKNRVAIICAGICYRMQKRKVTQ